MKRYELIKARKLQNFTQKNLAKKLNISTRHYQNLEYGISNPSLKVALGLRDILGISPDELFPKSTLE